MLSMETINVAKIAAAHVAAASFASRDAVERMDINNATADHMVKVAIDATPIAMPVTMLATRAMLKATLDDLINVPSLHSQYLKMVCMNQIKTPISRKRHRDESPYRMSQLELVYGKCYVCSKISDNSGAFCGCCNRVVCADCFGKRCFDCNHVTCKECYRYCKACDTDACRACYDFCQNCMDVRCKRHAVEYPFTPVERDGELCYSTCNVCR
jgi:hypothetical protein